MVRFIIFTLQFEKLGFIVFTFQYGQIYYHYICFNFSLKVTIYIPIWLDLLSMSFWKDAYNYIYLHSNMVRFIIQVFLQICTLVLAIYIPIWLDLLSAEDLTLIGQEAIYIPIWLDLLLSSLHVKKSLFMIFTFQYGQIYYSVFIVKFISVKNIYIPIWLDLLLLHRLALVLLNTHLHSNMVRFIIKRIGTNSSNTQKFTFQYGQIYYKKFR